MDTKLTYEAPEVELVEMAEDVITNSVILDEIPLE